MNHISIVFGLISLLSAKCCQLLSGADLLCDGFVALPPLTLTLFKAIYVTLKCAWFLNIDIFNQKGQFLLYRSFNTHSASWGTRPVKLKAISWGISSEWYTFFVSYNCIVWNWSAKLFTCKYVKCIRMQTST